VPPVVRRCHRKQALKFLRTRQRKRKASQLPQFSGRVLRWWSITSHPACLCLAGESMVLMHNLHPKCNCQPSTEGKITRSWQHTPRANAVSKKPCRLSAPFVGNHVSPGRAMRIPGRWALAEQHQQCAATTMSPTASRHQRTMRDVWWADRKTVFHWVSVR
jgi:hypothetical protein